MIYYSYYSYYLYYLKMDMVVDVYLNSLLLLIMIVLQVCIDDDVVTIIDVIMVDKFNMYYLILFFVLFVNYFYLLIFIIFFIISFNYHIFDVNLYYNIFTFIFDFLYVFHNDFHHNFSIIVLVIMKMHQLPYVDDIFNSVNLLILYIINFEFELNYFIGN